MTREPEDKKSNGERVDPAGAEPAPLRLLIRRVLRYAPNPLRDEWVNIGVLGFDPESGERCLRLVEEEDESVLPRLRDTLESLFTAEGRVADRGAAAASSGWGNSINWTRC